MTAKIEAGRLIRYENDSENYAVPDDVTHIAELAFSDCDRLISLHIPDSVTQIGNYAFANCYSLREIRLPARVIRSGAGLFQKCWNIREVVLPEGMRIIGTDMFEGCHALYALHIPDSAKSIERTAFSSCRSLRKVYIDPQRISLLPPSARYLSVLTYMEEHKPEDGNLLIDQYCEGRSKSLLDLAINRRSTEAVRYMLERDLVSQDILSDYLSKSVRTGRVEITALLLEYSSKDRNMSLDPDPFI